MPAAIPIAGYETMTEAVRALTEQGLSDAEISEVIGRPTNHVQAFRSARRPTNCVQMRVPHSTLKKFRAAARARHMRTTALARLLLETIAIAGLVDAVLDDKEEA